VSAALLYRIRRFADVGDADRHRTVKFKDGTELTYRLNRGDVRAIAETWMSGAYELPVTLGQRNIIDLGANIGSTSVWLARRYGAKRVLAVEPDPGNAELARINLRRNGIDAEVIEAAVGPHNGTIRFERSENSTLGRIGGDGIEVPLVTPQSLVERFETDEPILLKMDVEGAEAELFDADLGWLDRVECLVAELHADTVDVEEIKRKLTGRGFRNLEIGAGNLYLGPTDVMVVSVRDPA
jgi:FkbM family methyltransferase